jgi:hypothetical protein
MSCAASILLFVAIVASGSTYRMSIQRFNAVIYFQDGQIELVRVVNQSGHYCPAECAVQHRHRVHDVRWECTDSEDCEHFTVLHVIYDGEENRRVALERELENTEPGLTALAIH